jgi:hypothetical protein
LHAAEVGICQIRANSLLAIIPWLMGATNCASQQQHCASAPFMHPTPASWNSPLIQAHCVPAMTWRIPAFWSMPVSISPHFPATAEHILDCDEA